MRRRTFLTLGIEGIKASNAIVGDVCLYNKTTEKLCIQNLSDIVNGRYPKTEYTPIGLVVVPGTHNVYGDGSCGVMSLKNMSCSSPDEGINDDEGIYFGYQNDISELTNYNVVCIIDKNGEISNKVQTTSSNVGYFQLEDGDYSSSSSLIPSPYNEDDTRNTEYYRTSSPSSSKNALSDFNGKTNTETITSYVKSQTNWKTASTIYNFSSSGYYPAACCCWRYHTLGTKQGDWYLPAMGELGYLAVKITSLNDIFKSLNEIYDSTVCLEISENIDKSYFWCSTEYSSTYGRFLYTVKRSTNYNEKNKKHYVRAFLRVK